MRPMMVHRVDIHAITLVVPVPVLIYLMVARVPPSVVWRRQYTNAGCITTGTVSAAINAYAALPIVTPP